MLLCSHLVVVFSTYNVNDHNKTSDTVCTETPIKEGYIVTNKNAY